jgi:hypothetical protein
MDAPVRNIAFVQDLTIEVQKFRNAAASFYAG